MVMALDSGNAAAQLLRGKALLRLKRFPEAARELEAAVGANPQDLEAYAALGEAHLRSGNLQDALRAHRLAAEIDREDFRAALGTARVRLAQRRADLALPSLDEAARLSRGRAPEVLTERAACQSALGRPEKGVADYDAAIPLLEGRLQDLRRSRAVEAQAAEARAELASAYFGRGGLNEFLVKREAALSDYRQACALDHPQACRKAETLAPLPEAPAPPLARPQPAPRPAPQWKRVRPKKKRLPKPKSEPGKRIYVH